MPLLFVQMTQLTKSNNFFDYKKYEVEKFFRATSNVMKMYDEISLKPFSMIQH